VPRNPRCPLQRLPRDLDLAPQPFAPSNRIRSLVPMVRAQSNASPVHGDGALRALRTRLLERG
jgi:hypothetical protein